MNGELHLRYFKSPLPLSVSAEAPSVVPEAAHDVSGAVPGPLFGENVVDGAAAGVGSAASDADTAAIQVAAGQDGGVVAPQGL